MNLSQFYQDGIRKKQRMESNWTGGRKLKRRLICATTVFGIKNSKNNEKLTVHSSSAMEQHRLGGRIARGINSIVRKRILLAVAT